MPISEWKPTEEDIKWTEGILGALEMNQDWMEDEMAFRRTGTSTLSLLTRTERSEKAIERVKLVLDEIDWELNEEHAKVIPDDPQAAAEMMQKEADSWTCPTCEDIRVVNMDLSRVAWTVKGDTTYVDEGGDKQSFERWVVAILCECGEPVYLTPDDYFLVAGETNFYTWNFVDGDGTAWAARVMPIEQIVECVDSAIMGQINARHLGTTFQGNTVPPHMRGTFCMMLQAEVLGEEEE